MPEILEGLLWCISLATWLMLLPQHSTLGPKHPWAAGRAEGEELASKKLPRALLAPCLGDAMPPKAQSGLQSAYHLVE